jgi:hypothetical protein
MKVMTVSSVCYLSHFIHALCQDLIDYPYRISKVKVESILKNNEKAMVDLPI